MDLVAEKISEKIILLQGILLVFNEIMFDLKFNWWKIYKKNFAIFPKIIFWQNSCVKLSIEFPQASKIYRKHHGRKTLDTSVNRGVNTYRLCPASPSTRANNHANTKKIRLPRLYLPQSDSGSWKNFGCSSRVFLFSIPTKDMQLPGITSIRSGNLDFFVGFLTREILASNSTCSSFLKKFRIYT